MEHSIYLPHTNKVDSATVDFGAGNLYSNSSNEAAVTDTIRPDTKICSMNYGRIFEVLGYNI